MLRAGYKLSAGASSEFTLPENWDANSANGLFNAAYIHPNDDSIKFSLQSLFVGGKFEVYISDDKDHTHSIELSVDHFIASGESTAPISAAGLLRNLNTLREKFTPFAENIRPAKKKEAAPTVSSPGFVRPPDRDDRGYGVPSPSRFPPVGGGDAFPPGLGGGNPDMLVGPGHPLFGHRGDPSMGPVPGARFDPFGPSIDPLGPSGGFRPPSRGPAPTMPFGGPGPDHLRMPRDDDMDPGFGFSGGRRGGGITDATQGDDLVRTDHLNSLTELCSSPLSPSDVELLKQLKSHLLSGQLQAVDNDDASELHTAKWQLLTGLLRVDGIESTASEQDLQTILSLMLTDRFESSDVLAAMAQWLVEMKSKIAPAIVNLLDVKLTSREEEGSYLDVIKQMYVTLGSSSLRQELAGVLEKLVTMKGQAKQVVKSGVLRCLLQVALEQPDDIVDGVLSQNFALVGMQVASLVCFGSASELSTKKVEKDDVMADKRRRDVCELVVRLMLSGVSLVFADAVRMLQLLIDNASCRALLPAVPDLRGALEKAHTLARLRDNKVSHDEYLKALCEAQYGVLSPEIDMYDCQHGSVVGLPPNDETAQSGELALEMATNYKTQGNAFFRRGNYPTARVFYRRAIAVLRAAQLQQETSLRSLSVDELLAHCSIGASVQVRPHRGDEWQDAMVSEVEENGTSSRVEVLYDAGDREDEWVPISRIRLRMNTTLLSAFDDLAVDCSMNMGKAFTALGDHDQAVQCFTHALSLRGGKLISALYSRGVANMARRDLTAAQQDLWEANQQCRMQQKNSISGGTSKTNTRDAEQMRVLHKQIVAAYKKLQQMHANKKRLDKKVIKQMVKYLSTIPELQDQ
ncbi:PI31 proteasome regulator, N-terminal [Phytophthora cactorum]|nr:PI31 proteasome regulator, N-terminal [Phytophthora cactorum]